MGDNFISKARLVASKAMENPAEVIAKGFVNDRPSIETAVKSYLSLLGAKHISDDTKNAEPSTAKVPRISDQKILLSCARYLLKRINIFTMPDVPVIEIETQEIDLTKELEYNTLRIIWNNFVSSSQNNNKDQKPAKFLGRSALLIVYPMILYDIKSKSPVIPGEYDEEEILKFFIFFGSLLISFNDQEAESLSFHDDDSQLLWARDRGASELARRRERRASEANRRSST